MSSASQVPGLTHMGTGRFRELSRRPKYKISADSWLPPRGEKEVTYDLTLVNGVYQMKKHREGNINDLINTFETRDDDLFVCTYVKSGTTWTQQIIALLLNNGEQSDKTYSAVVPWLESTTFDSMDPETNREAPGWTLDKINLNVERRFFKTHANLKDIPAGSARGLKVIYVARNPKDVCVSLYHHAKNKPLNNFNGDLSDMLRFFVLGRCENGSWFDHVLEWWEAARADPEHVLFLKYEDMCAHPEENIRKIADFAGIACAQEVISKTAAASTISAMKQNPKSNIMAELNHLRKGGAGGWRDVFTVRESEAFDTIYRQQMSGSGLQMDFGEGLQL